jgi:hypothetical protein
VLNEFPFVGRFVDFSRIFRGFRRSSVVSEHVRGVHTILIFPRVNLRLEFVADLDESVTIMGVE